MLLANAGIDILVKHNETKSNALHIALEREHYDVCKMLISSKFSVNNKKEDNITPLIIAAKGITSELTKKTKEEREKLS